MNVKQLINQMDLQIVSGEALLEQEIKSGFVGDLLSVVMGKAKEGSAWVTIQGHVNIVAVATLVGVACVIITEGFEVEALAIEKAKEEDIVLLTTKLSSYQVVTKMSELGIY